jgi:hypothetical protein
MALVLALGAAACEPGTARVTAPSGSDALARFVVIGGAVAMGVGSDGVVAESQGTSWPALVAADAGVAFRQPLLRTPGCSPPLVGPLIVGRWLSGTATTARDSSCAGAATGEAPPGDNLALAGATAWAALHVTPRSVTSAPAAWSVVDRQRYPLVLGATQSQVTAMLVKAPTFVAVELGLAEVVRAIVSGRVVAATSYTDAAAWTYVPAPLFTTAFDQVADSVAKSGARVVVLTVPRTGALPALRAASAVWSERTTLAGFGVTVQGDCAASPNTLNVGALVPARALRAIATGVAQPLSCADVPGAMDSVLTSADRAALDATIDAMNAHLAQAAAARGWALANLTDAFATIAGSAGPYDARDQLTCVTPYGYFGSLDGFHPGPAGQRLIADQVARAVNTTYGFALREAGVPFDIRTGC